MNILFHWKNMETPEIRNFSKSEHAPQQFKVLKIQENKEKKYLI